MTIGSDIVATQPQQEAPQEQSQQPLIPQQRTQIDWGALVKDLVIKHPKEIKSLVRDLEPDDREMIFQIIEAKYPGYSGIAKMIIGSGNGNGNEEPQYEDDPDNPEDEQPERAPSSSIMKQAIEDAVTMYEAGMPPKEISEQIYSLYELDWSVQAVYRIVQRHQAFKQAPAPKKEEIKVQIPKEPHRGIIRKLWHWVW